MYYAKYETVLKKGRVREDIMNFDIMQPSKVYEFATKVLKMNSKPQEYLYAIFLSTKGDIIGVNEVSRGNLFGTIASPREIFRVGVMLPTYGIILIHNHPSGDPTPSNDDINLTQKVNESGKILDIPLVDHLIVGDEKYYSFKEHGYI